MRKYLGLISILILVATFLILQSLVGIRIGHLWVWITVIGYLGSAAASWYSPKGFWKKASATILIGLPVGFIVLVLVMIIGLQGATDF